MSRPVLALAAGPPAVLVAAREAFLRQIRDRSPVIRELLTAGALGLVASMYDLETGRVTFDEEATGSRESRRF